MDAANTSCRSGVGTLISPGTKVRIHPSNTAGAGAGVGAGAGAGVGDGVGDGAAVGFETGDKGCFEAKTGAGAGREFSRVVAGGRRP